MNNQPICRFVGHAWLKDSRVARCASGNTIPEATLLERLLAKYQMYEVRSSPWHCQVLVSDAKGPDESTVSIFVSTRRIARTLVRRSTIILQAVANSLATRQARLDSMDAPRSPPTPPRTPPATELHSHDTLHIHYCDFAAEQRGPFRMAVTDIGDTTAKTFAESVCRHLNPASNC